jgi:hypothetical protein
MKVQWRPTISVLSIPSSYEAITLLFSTMEGFPLHLVLFVIGILSKNSARRKMCDVTAVYGGPLGLTGKKIT